MLHFLQDLSPHVTGVALGGGRSAGAIFKIDAHASVAAPSEDENGPPALGAIFKIDLHAACAAPSDGENGPRTLGYFLKCATFWTIFPGLKRIKPKLLYKM